MKGGGPPHGPAQEKQTLKRMQLTALKEEEDPLPWKCTATEGPSPENCMPHLKRKKKEGRVRHIQKCHGGSAWTRACAGSNFLRFFIARLRSDMDISVNGHIMRENLS